jgi:hypothetical protein
MKGTGDGGNGIKYIGQHVFDFVSSFRNNVNIGTDALDADLFLNDLSNITSGIPSGGKILIIDSNNKVGYRTFAQVLSDIGGGDITGVSVSDGSNLHDITSGNFALAFTAGTGIDLGLTGSSTGATNGNLTISVDNVPVANGGTGATSFNANGILVGNGTSAVQDFGSKFSYTDSSLFSITADGVRVTSANDGDPQLNLINTNDGAVPPSLNFIRQPADNAGANGDEIGQINYTMDDSAGNPTTFVQTNGVIDVATDGQESGRYVVQVASHDAELQIGLDIVGGSAEDEIDVTIASGAASVTTIEGTLTMGSTAFVDNSGVIQVATQGTIDHDSLANFVAAEHYRWDTDISSTATIHANNITDLHGAGVDGAANQLLTDDGDGTVTSEANLTFSSGSLLAQKDGGPVTLIANRTDTGEDNDIIGALRFSGTTDADTTTRYVALQGKILDASNATPQSEFKIDVYSDSSTESFKLSGDNGSGRVDVNLAAGSSSVTTIAGTLTMGSTAFVNNSGVIQVATQGTIDHDSLANFVAAEHYRWDNDISATATINAANIPTLNQSTTGNAATATALTSGDKTIEGNLRIGGSGDTSNNWISIDAQNGSDTTGGGITFYETGTYSVSAPQYGAKIVYNEDDDELAIGTMHNNTFMRQIHMDRGSSAVYLTNLVVQNDGTNGPYTYYKNLDTSIADGDILARTLVYTADRDAIISRMRWIATEDHDSNSGGCKIDFIITPNGDSQSETTAMTIGQDSSLTVNGNIELGHASDTTIARSAAGTVTIEGNQIVTENKQLQAFPCSFFDDIGTTKHYIPMSSQTQSEQTSDGNTATDFLVPCNTKVKEVMVRLPGTTTGSGDLTIGIETANIGASVFSKSIVETETVAVASSNDNDIAHFMFDDTTHATIGQNLSISIQASSDLSASQNWYVIVILEFDWSTRHTSSSAIQTS